MSWLDTDWCFWNVVFSIILRLGNTISFLMKVAKSHIIYPSTFHPLICPSIFFSSWVTLNSKTMKLNFKETLSGMLVNMESFMVRLDRKHCQVICYLILLEIKLLQKRTNVFTTDNFSDNQAFVCLKAQKAI